MFHHKQQRILLCGSLIVDYLKVIDGYPNEGMLENIHEVKLSTGGMVNNNAANLKRLDPGLIIGAMGKIGNDRNGRLIRKHLDGLGVDTSMIVEDTQTVTAFTDVFTVKAAGRRTFFHYSGANARWGPDDICWEKIAGRFDLVQMGYLLLMETMDSRDETYGTKGASILAKFKELGLKTSIDLVSATDDRFAAVVSPALPYVDYLIINEIEAEGISGIKTRSGSGKFEPKATAVAAQKLLSMGVREVVVIHSPEGAVAQMKNGETEFNSSYLIKDEEIRSTVGAGDAFASGVLYGLIQGWSLTETLSLGAAMGAMNLLSDSASEGAKPLSEVRRFMRERPLRTMKI